MTANEKLDPVEVGRLLGLIVHDLRNPTSTLSANADFVKEVGIADDEAREALADMSIAVQDLKQGLEQIAWVGRWLMGQEALPSTEGDVGMMLERSCQDLTTLPVELSLHREQSLVARGASGVPKLVQILLSNVRENVRKGPVKVDVRREGRVVVVELTDPGRAIGPQFRELAFTIPGQHQIKGRGEGRYGRFIGLLSVRALADGMGAQVSAGGEDGAAVFRIELEGR